MFLMRNFEEPLNSLENEDIILTGEVVSVGDGIVYVSGLDEIESGAVVNIESS